MSIIQKKYISCCNEINSDINEHLPTLRRYANECYHITECGVRSCKSSYAFADALRGRPSTILVQYDTTYHPKMDIFMNDCKNEGIYIETHIESDLTCRREKTDLLFIDTWHIYGQLKRELEYWNEYVNKYIIMHDTTVDEWHGEVLRSGGNPIIESQVSGFSIKDVSTGLWPAIEEFLEAHTEWKLHERYTNNNGLTILKRL
jgi:hypothetical protein